MTGLILILVILGVIAFFVMQGVRSEAAAIREATGKSTGELTKEDMEKVTELDLIANQLTNVKRLEELTQLRTLDLSENQISDVSPFKELTQLRELDLHNNPDLTKAQIAELQKALPKCKISNNPTK
jgi:internalin A